MSGSLDRYIVGDAARMPRIVRGGVEFADASWVSAGVLRARMRSEPLGPGLNAAALQVFEGGGGMTPLHAAARAAAQASDDTAAASPLPPRLLAALSAGIPTVANLVAAARALGDDESARALQRAASEISGDSHVMLTSLRQYEVTALEIARRLESRSV